MDNIEVVYLYRDGGNNKKSGSVVFSNPSAIAPESVEGALQRAFLQDGLFVASQIRVPEVFLFAGGEFSFDEHCYHELDGVWPTSKSTDDLLRRSISEFLLEVTREAQRGWRVFDPYDSEGSFGSFLTSHFEGANTE